MNNLTREVYYGSSNVGILYFDFQRILIKKISFFGDITYEKKDGRNEGPQVIESNGWMGWFNKNGRCVKITTHENRTVYYD